MTTSYKLEAQRQLKIQKKLTREIEAAERKAAESVPEITLPEPKLVEKVVEKETMVDLVVKKARKAKSKAGTKKSESNDEK
jgi:hypothetical protein